MALLLASLGGTLCSAALAARPVEQQIVWDDTVKGILCSGLNTLMNDRLNANVVRIFSAPEKDVYGWTRMRLYVGFVQDPASPDKGQAFYKGPVAEAWDAPRLPPGNDKTPADKRPLRYWINRQDRGPDGKAQVSTVEIDMEGNPPVLRTMIRQPGQPPREAREALEAQPLTTSTRLLLRSLPSAPVTTEALVLREFSLTPEAAPQAGARALQPVSPGTPDFFAVATRDGEHCVIQALPRASFWGLQKVLALPPQHDPRGVFLVEMIEEYLPPGPADQARVLHRRVHVRVGLNAISAKVVEDGLVFDVERGTYSKAQQRKGRP